MRGFHNAQVDQPTDTVASLRAALEAIQCECMLNSRGSITVAVARLNAIADQCARALRESA
jgi:hypothetical protein